MNDVEHLLHEYLKKNGYSVTKARKLVFKAMEQQEPLSIAELINKLRGIVDRASVYRAIALFERIGIVHRLQLGWKYKLELSDAFSYHHHHISCVECHQVYPIREDVTLEAAVKSLAQEYGFSSSAHQVEIQGVCAACQRLKT